MFLENKYTKWYFEIVKNSLSGRIKSGYTEAHHIVPRCMGGNDDTSNLVNLTAREHYICHLLLTKMTKGQIREKLVHAVMLMGRLHEDNQLKLVSRTVAKLREDHARIISARMKNNKHSLGKKHTDEWKKHHSEKMSGENNPMFGVIRPQRWRNEHSQFMSDHNPMKGRLGPEHPSFGKPHKNKGKSLTEIMGADCATQTKERLSESAKNREKLTCPHCGKTGHPGNMKRWHFDKCKNIK